MRESAASKRLRLASEACGFLKATRMTRGMAPVTLLLLLSPLPLAQPQMCHHSSPSTFPAPSPHHSPAISCRSSLLSSFPNALHFPSHFMLAIKVLVPPNWFREPPPSWNRTDWFPMGSRFRAAGSKKFQKISTLVLFPCEEGFFSSPAHTFNNHTVPWSWMPQEFIRLFHS